METTTGELGRLYDALARYGWTLRRLRGARPGQGLEIHKRLTPEAGPGPGEGSGPAPGSEGLDPWLHERLHAKPSARVLDAGCGFGATLFTWAQRHPGGGHVGLSLSPYQIAKATAEARRLDLADRCRFHTQSYDEPLARELGSAAPFDFVLSIESLFHAPDLARTMERLSGHLTEGGTLALVEDMAVDAGVAAEPDGAQLARLWSTLHLHSVDEYGRALSRAGLELREEIDLTARVERRATDEIERRERLLLRLRRLLPFSNVRRVLDAFLGGLALERLYARGRMRYLVMIAVRTGGEG